MISNLLAVCRKALKTLIEFLTVLLLGLLAAILLALPWLLRALALIAWLAGTFLTWLTINRLYSGFTPVLPLVALTAVPAVLSVALVVWVFYIAQRQYLWSVMALWGALGFLVWKGSMLLTNWRYGMLVIQVFPAVLCAVLLLYINIRWGLVIRARRLTKKVQA